MTHCPVPFLDHGDLDKIASAVFDVLGNVGIRIESAEILEAVGQQGAVVDHARQVARFPALQIERVLERQRQQAERSAAAATAKGGPRGWFASMGNVANFYYDWEMQKARRATEEEFLTMVHLGDALEEVDGVAPPLIMSDKDPRVEPVESVVLLIQHAHQPGGVDETLPEQIEFLAEIGSVVAGDPGRFVSPCVYLTAPLVFGARSAGSMLEKIRCGVPIKIGTMATSGNNAPVTREGTVVVAAAEVLGGWICARACDPEGMLTASICSGSTNMATASASYSSPDAMLEQLAVYYLFKHLCGGGALIGGISLIDAKRPGLQAAVDRILKTMVMGFYLDAPPYTVGAIGTLDSINAFSPVQAMVDLDIKRALDRVLGGLDVSEASLAVDVIKEVGIGGSFLQCDHTIESFREVCWFPHLLGAKILQGENEDKVLARADEQWREALASYEPPAVDAAVLREVNRILEHARKHLL